MKRNKKETKPTKIIFVAISLFVNQIIKSFTITQKIKNDFFFHSSNLREPFLRRHKTITDLKQKNTKRFAPTRLTTLQFVCYFFSVCVCVFVCESDWVIFFRILACLPPTKQSVTKTIKLIRVKINFFRFSFSPSSFLVLFRVCTV